MFLKRACVASSNGLTTAFIVVFKLSQCVWLTDLRFGADDVFLHMTIQIFKVVIQFVLPSKMAFVLFITICFI